MPAVGRSPQSARLLTLSLIFCANHSPSPGSWPFPENVWGPSLTCSVVIQRLVNHFISACQPLDQWPLS